MALRVDRRPHDAFLSHAHVDAEFATTLYRWLTRWCGLDIWFDAKSMAANDSINKKLQDGIEKSRALIVVASEEALAKGWVQHEIDIGVDEQKRDPRFKVISIAIGDADMDDVSRGFSQIRLEQPVLDDTLAMALMRAFHPPRPPIRQPDDPLRRRDAYCSLGWREGEEHLSAAIAMSAEEVGFRLVGDATDRKSYGRDRIVEIMQTCGAFLCILPWRGEAEAWAQQTDRGKSTYRYFLQEIDKARDLGLPSLVIAPQDLKRIDGEDGAWLRIPQATYKTPQSVRDALENLRYDWERPENEDMIFLATDFSEDPLLEDNDLPLMIEAITGMRTVIGRDLRGGTVQDKIIETIRDAHLIVADLSGVEERDFNLNVCIETGIAKSYGRHVRMIARGPSRSPPFMLRTIGQLDGYANQVERIGLVRRIAAEFRRNIIGG